MHYYEHHDTTTLPCKARAGKHNLKAFTDNFVKIQKKIWQLKQNTIIFA